MFWLSYVIFSYETKQMNPLEAIGHATSALFLIGMILFFWMIFKKTRKVYRRGQKAQRRERKYNKSKCS